MATKTREYSDAPMLSASWINERVDNVLDRLEDIFDHLLDDGILSEGVFPFTTPLTPKLLKRMPEEEVKKLVESAESPEEQSSIMDMINNIEGQSIPEPNQ